MKKPWYIKAAYIVCAVGLLALSFAAGHLFSKWSENTDSPFAALPFSETATLHFILPDHEEQMTVKVGESAELLIPEEIPDYTFIGWRSEQNDLEKRETVPVYRDTYYSAVYAVALERKEHRPYLFPDERGLYRPDAPLTRADAVRMLYALLSVPIYTEESFLDVEAEDPIHAAASAMKSLGVIEGVYLHPEDVLTRAELFEMLACFYPAGRDDVRFADLKTTDPYYPAFCTAAEQGWINGGPQTEADASHVMTRAETAALMNRMLGRCADSKLRPAQIGILPDVKSSHDAYWDMVEACISHVWDGQPYAEIWTESVPVEQIPEGLYLDGYELYAIDKKGYLVCGTEYHGFQFDENGCYTSGRPELDELVRALFVRLFDESMDREEMLHTAYRYTVNNYKYLKRNYYERLDVSWLLDEAYTMLSTGKGNCYNFAGAFCMMARALGYDAKPYSGAYGNIDAHHAWVDIEIDGKNYMFDPEIEYAMIHTESNANLYMMTESLARALRYIR